METSELKIPARQFIAFVEERYYCDIGILLIVKLMHVLMFIYHSDYPLSFHHLFPIFSSHFFCYFLLSVNKLYS